jgi:kynurenine formamidase
MPEEAWGRWGPEDEAGALNLVGTEQVKRASGLVRQGRTVVLGQPLGPKTPVPPHRKPVERLMMRDGGDYAAGGRSPGGFQFAEEVLGFAAHSGTHMDALAHAWYGDRLYNGFSSTTVRSTTGAQRCGADKLRPVVTRGILLDVQSVRAEPLEAGDVVGLDDLRAAAASAGVEPETGDVVLVRTGWFGSRSARPDEYLEGEPGIDVTAARWLAEAGVAAVGADNYAIEVLPFASEDVFPVHKLLVRDFGMPLIEGMVLDELAEAGASAFMLVVAPLPVVGGTAGPVCPVAVL